MSSGEDGALAGTSDGLDGDTLGSTAAPARSRADVGLVRGAAVGRYVVLGPLGAGGMSIVYAAYDPELDRKVALKLLRPTMHGSHAQDDRARLVREAQAMARLSHANVVSVYDVGTTGENDAVFLAMQFIDGVTLKEWLARPRSWREIVDAFVQAARGLDAAHAVGLVHRDFKPDNVLVDDAGVARVTDFGLARDAAGLSVSDSGPGATPAPSPEESMAALMNVTAAGIVLGTPAYMAPEQHERSPLDARSDQFSFCVALWEALFGERPFAGRSIAEVAYEVTRGNLRAAPQKSPVPPRVRRALVRGLSRDPDQRHPNMASLIDTLADHGRERRPLLFAGALALVGAGAVGAFVAMGGAADRCDRGSERLAGVWDQARRAELGAAFAAVPRADATSVGQRVDARLTEYARAWSDAAQAACEATLVEGVQSDEALDVRMQCFDRRLVELGGLVDVLVAVEIEALDRAVFAADTLVALSECDDVERLRQRSPMPDDPNVRAQLIELEREIARADALSSTGAYARAARSFEQLLPIVEQAGYLPLLARARLDAAWARYGLGDVEVALRLAYDGARAAETAHDDTLAEQAWIDLLDMTGSSGSHTGEVAVLSEVARAAIARSGDKHVPLTRYEIALGGYAQARGDYRLARKHFEAALALLDADDHHETVRTAVLNNLGVVLLTDGDFLGARVLFLQAVELTEAYYGDTHPNVAEQLGNIATTHVVRGEYAEAVPYLERASRNVERISGPDAITLVPIEVVQSQASLGLGQLEEARRQAEHALVIAERAFGVDSPVVAAVLNNLGRVSFAMGRLDLARQEQGRALSLLATALGDEHPDLAAPIVEISRVDLREGNVEQACHGFARALRIAEAGFGREHYRVQDALAGLGACELERGRADAAIEPLERALEIRERVGCDASDLALTQLTLSRALWALGRQRARARELAERAHALLGAPHQAADRAAAAAWLAQTR